MVIAINKASPFYIKCVLELSFVMVMVNEYEISSKTIPPIFCKTFGRWVFLSVYILWFQNIEKYQVGIRKYLCLSDSSAADGSP